MRIEIEIPVEFEEHFNRDKFEDTLHRLSTDAHLLVGRYEKETAIMLIKAFADSKPAFDTEKVVEQLNNVLQDLNVIEILSQFDPDSTIQTSLDRFLNAIRNEVLNIVKKGGVE